MWLLTSCVAAPAPGPATGAYDTGALTVFAPVPGDTSDTAPPVAVVTVVEGEDEHHCAEDEVSMWGPYDRTAPEALWGTEWEYWSAGPVTDGCTDVQTQPGGDCDPACASDEFCDPSGVCQPYPGRLDVGAVALGGLAAPLDLTRTSLGTYAATETPPHPLFASDTVTATASGGADLDGFALAGRVPEPLDATLDCSAFVDASEPVTLTWTAGDPHDRVRLHLSTLAHGGGIGDTFCEGPDTGSLTVPWGVGAHGGDWGYSVQLTRYSRTAAPLGAGAVRLEVGRRLVCSNPSGC